MDIVEELRRIERADDLPPKGHPILAKRAADEIERLRAKVEAMELALRTAHSQLVIGDQGRDHAIACILAALEK